MTLTRKAAIVLIVLLGTVNGIRFLKDVPKPGPDSRLYKHATQATAAVQVQCTDDTMVITVQADFYGNGHRITADQLRLGLDGFTGNCRAIQLNDEEYVIDVGLHECGSEILTDDDTLVYANTVYYTPTPSKVGIVRSTGAAVHVQCHYKRTHFVSSNAQQNQQMMLSTKASPWFCLKLMSDNWTTVRSSSVYHWGNVINMEASVVNAGQTPVKLFLDSCVATVWPNSGSMSTYPLIHNHGCAAEPTSPRSNICFLPRTKDQVLRVQMDTRWFYSAGHDAGITLYITCVLKVANAAREENFVNKACTFSGHRWRSLDGEHQVCDCCASTCDVISQRRTKTSASSDSAMSAVVTVGPVTIQDQFSLKAK
ncbi:zona pellucida sperm-binding protein 3-like [Brachyhypopomus gauderio]|uniref:zona pellucida sperm-binding protein 3-like n=1 Tax=Brachyhypopomus gauderio TaxID=698409 RepID=UPI00404199E1